MRLTLLLLIALAARAEDLYLGAANAGAADATSCANARIYTWFNTAGNWGGGAGEIDPGDTVHLCGTITGTAGVNGLTTQASGTAGNVITIKFETDAVMTAPYWSTNDGTNPNGGAIVVAHDYIVVDGGTNGVIRNSANGTARTYQAKTAGLYLNGANLEIKNLRIEELYVRTPYSSDTYAGASGAFVSYAANRNDISFHHNTISDIGAAFNGPYCGSARWSIYNNTMSRASAQIAVGSANTGCTFTDLFIYGNDMSDNYVWWDAANNNHLETIHLWAAHSGSSITNVDIYNNYVHGNFGGGDPSGGPGHTTAWIYSEADYVDTANLRIFNNVLVASNAGDYGSNGFIYLKRAASAQIYNNTISSVADAGIGVSSSGAAMTLKNNVITGVSQLIATSGACATVTADYNAYYAPDAFMICGGSSYSVAAWQGLGKDASALTSNPLLTGAYALGTGSPAIGAGANLSALGITALNSDKNGRVRGANWSIGAYEFAPPTTLRGTLRGATIK